jgi:hypothetical protein
MSLGTLVSLVSLVPARKAARVRARHRQGARLWVGHVLVVFTILAAGVLGVSFLDFCRRDITA